MSITFDNALKRSGIEEEYTEEQIQEIYKCSKDIFHFLKYVKIIHPDRGRINFQDNIYDFQEDIIQSYLNNRFLVLLLARQVGKCLESHVKIKLKNKITGKIEEIEIGKFFDLVKKSKQNLSS